MTAAEGFAYGLHFHGAALGAGLLPGQEPGGWPAIAIRQLPDRRPDPRRVLGECRAEIPLIDGVHAITMSRASAIAIYHGPPIPPDELVHPHLVPTAVVFSRWYGRETFHAGALLVDGGAWAVVGQARAGKSTLLAAFAARGGEVLSDDLLVVEHGWAFAGPRSIDLREPLPAALGAGLVYEHARGGTRLRVRLPPVQPSAPLRGWLFLGWGEHELHTIRAAERLTRLAAWRSVPELASDPAELLALAALPAFTHVNHKEWAALERTLELLGSRLRAV